MKGEIKKINNNWVINHNQITYPLHPDDVEQILQDSKIFDNIDARIAAYPNVEFQLIKKYLYNETITYAKLLTPKKENPTDLNPDQWILIKKETLHNLINDFKEKDVDTEILIALFKWIQQNNTLS